MFLTEKLQRTVEDLLWAEDSQERLAEIVDRSKKVSPLGPAERIEANCVRGCVSVVWLAAEEREGRCYFRGDAESPLVRGLVLFLADFFSGAPVEEMATSNDDPLSALGLLQNLSPTRRNGLAAVREAMRGFAVETLKKV